MSDEPTLALAVSSRPWPDRLRQTLADHGGARVRLTALGPHDLDEEDYDVLFVDDVCSFFTRGLVGREQSRGRVVVGVYDRDEPAGRAHLLDAGVDTVIGAHQTPEEFVALARSRAATSWRRDNHQPVAAAMATPALGRLVTVAGVSAGVGGSEIALALTCTLPAAALVELASPPSLAQRLGVELHPNLVTAIEMIDHGDGDLSPALQRLAAGTLVLVGAPEHSGREIAGARRVIERLRRTREWTVLDAGPANSEPGSGELLAVTRATPVGIARCVDRLRGSDLERTHVVLNGARGGAFERAEALASLLAEIKPKSVTVVPDDPRVSTAAWNGGAVRRGPFLKAIDSVACALVAGT